MKLGRSTIGNIFLAATTLLVATILFTYVVGLVTIQSNRKVAQVRTILQRLEQVSSTLRDAQTAQREFILTGDEQTLKPYRRALVQLRAEEALVLGFGRAGELPAAAVDGILRLAEEKITELQQGIQVRRDSDLEPALSLVRAEEGKATLDRLHEGINRLAAEQQILLEQAARRAGLADTWRSTVFVVTIIFNLAFLAWAYRRILREVRLRAATALENNRQKDLLATTLASIGDGVIACDSDARLTFLNPEAERLTGWSNQDAAGKALGAVFRLVEEQTGKPLSNPAEEVLRLGSTAGLPEGSVLVKRNGDLVPIGDSAAPIRQSGGAIAGAVVVFRDITEQRRNEETRARLAAIVQSSGDAILSDNLEGTIQSWNAAAERMFRYRGDQAVGQPSGMLVPPEQAVQEKQVLERIRQGRPAEQFETVRLARGGKRIPVLLTVSPLQDPSGHIVGTSRIIRDITELVEARETLSRGKQELERLVTARTAKLREMITELQHISYAITHDMRAPLRAMGAFAQILLEESLAAGRESQNTEYCHRIITAAGRLDTLIRDALSFTGTVLQELPLQPVDLFTLVRGIVDTYPNLQASAADVQIEGSLPAVLGNESLLTQCFSNLLGNAVKFVAPGVRPKVRIWAQPNGTAVRIWVQDNGIGIAKHAHSRLFSMFQKVDNRYEGTGVGLAIVRKVAHHMGGRVGVESDLGAGSRFWVELRTPAP